MARQDAVPSDQVSEYANCSITVGFCSSSTPGRLTLVRSSAKAIVRGVQQWLRAVQQRRLPGGKDFALFGALLPGHAVLRHGVLGGQNHFTRLQGDAVAAFDALQDPLGLTCAEPKRWDEGAGYVERGNLRRASSAACHAAQAGPGQHPGPDEGWGLLTGAAHRRQPRWGRVREPTLRGDRRMRDKRRHLSIIP
jgi:hypothetical protein